MHLSFQSLSGTGLWVVVSGSGDHSGWRPAGGAVFVLLAVLMTRPAATGCVAQGGVVRECVFGVRRAQREGGVASLTPGRCRARSGGALACAHTDEEEAAWPRWRGGRRS